MKRYTERPFPPYLFVPGKSPHPEKQGGYHFGKELEFENIGDDVFKNADFLYAIDLYNHKYFWEAHVFLEGLWHQVRKTQFELADFLKGLIKLCACGVKKQQGMPVAAKGHYDRAMELFSELDSDRVKRVMSLLVK